MEKQIQSKIKKKLQGDGWLVIKLIKTSHNGIPDLMALKDGKVIFIEVKQENGTLSKLQQDRISELREKGFECKIWTNYETDFKSR